jgi:hypothetical protein
MSRVWKRIAWATAICVAALVVAAWITLTMLFTRPESFEPTSGGAPVTLLPWPEHDAIYQRAQFPYVLRLARGPAELLYIGAQHTADAADPQLTQIERLWKEFRPTVALCEGRARTFRYASRPETGELTEWQLVRILAQRDGIRLYTLEPAYEAEVKGLLTRFEPRLVATYLTLRVYTYEAQGYDGDRDALAAELLRKRTDVEPLRGSLSSIDQLDVYWRERFPHAPDWRSLKDTEELPLLVEVGNVSREVRGDHMVRTLNDLMNRGERVLAVVGASHVIRQEPALRNASNRSRP